MKAKLLSLLVLGYLFFVPIYPVYAQDFVDKWKSDVYEKKYNEAIIKYYAQKKDVQEDKVFIQGKISYYKGLCTTKSCGALTTACWDIYLKGQQFKVSYRGKSVVVTCNDRGHFRELGVALDLNTTAFEWLAPKSQGIIRGAEIEVLP